MKDLPYVIAICCLTAVICIDFSWMNLDIPILTRYSSNLVILLFKVVILLFMIGMILQRIRSREDEGYDG